MFQRQAEESAEEQEWEKEVEEGKSESHGSQGRQTLSTSQCQVSQKG